MKAIGADFQNNLAEIKQSTSALARLGSTQWTAIITGSIAVVAGIVVLIGWALDQEDLKRLSRNLVAMNPATATCFLLIGLGMLAAVPGSESPSVSWFNRFAGGVVGIVGLTKLLDLTLQTRFDFDDVIFAGKLASATAINTNAMAPNTAACLLLLGVATAYAPTRNRRAVIVGQCCALAVFLIATIAITGYIYGALTFYIVGTAFPMALHTAITAAVVAIGILASHRHEGVMSGIWDFSKRNNLPFNIWLLLAAFLLLLAIIVAAFWGEQQASKAFARVEHTRAVQTNALTLLSLVQGFESAERAYVATQNRHYLERHEAALKNIEATQAQLRQTVTGPNERQRIEQFEMLVTEKIGLIEDIDTLQSAGAHESAVALMDNDRSKDIADRTRALVADMNAAEGQQVARNEAALSRILLAVRVTEGTGLLVLLIVAAAAIRQIRRAHETQQNAAKLQARAIEAEAAANRSKTTFLASMSHEIRTPLNGVIGNLELLAQSELKVDQQQLLVDADKAAKSLLALIGNVLDFAKIEAGKLSIENVEMSPASLAQEAVDILQSRARQKGIQITASFGAGVPEVVTGDPNRLRQILLNLLGNAVKFTAEGGVHLRVEVKDWDGRICNLLFLIHDSGRGFEQSKAQELFLPFTQDYKAGTQNYEGTGLGLSICRSLVETFGGEISCESEPGQGSTFRFTMPVQTVTEAAIVKRLDLKGRTVMFITAVLQGEPKELERYFIECGAHVVTVSSLEEATAAGRDAIARDSHIDMAIYVMHRNVLPAIGMMSTLRDQHTVPIIYAPSADAVNWRQTLRTGAAYILFPHTDRAELDRNVAHLMGGRSPVETKSALGDAGQAAAFAGHRVLVLEDRLVNQTVIHRQLKSLGLDFVIAADGSEGIARIDKAETFDVILCDCSMPVMNGYEFTRALRSWEQSNGQERTPVVAMTANAFREDMEKCFDAGMDDFLAKPVTLNRLSVVLTKWLKGKAEVASEEPLAVRDPASAPIDRALLAGLLGQGDDGLVDEMLAAFRSAAVESWAEVDRAIAIEDADQLVKAAHGAKGESRSAGATFLGALYERVEQAGKARDAVAAATLRRSLREEVDNVLAYIDGAKVERPT